MADGDISRIFGSHALARQAATELEQSGIDHGHISVIDSGGGTVLTVCTTSASVALVEAILTQHATLPANSPPLDDTAALHDSAPSYVAGGTANLGTPGPG